MDLQQLRERQSWTLSQKIDHSLGTIDEFYQKMDGKCYVSFSGGKDSTVALWLTRKIYPTVTATFCNTGNEYPDIVKFVRGVENVDCIKPKLKPKEVIEKFGFPITSKETSRTIHDIKINPNSVRSQRGLGILKTKFRGTVPEKYMYLVYAPYMVSDRCCRKLKKEPFHKYEKEKGVSPILGTMADESISRTTTYIKGGGCNIFNQKGKSMSMPLSIWKEQDIWDCIEKYDIPISDIYHKGAQRTGCMFCAYGAHYPGDNRLQLVYDVYPKWYQTFMEYSNNGVTYREALRDILATNNLKLPDEQ